MNYQDTVAYLYAQLPFFQKMGEKAIKPKLTNIIALLDHVGNPQHYFKSIHVAGTNGKGSSSHMLASILMEAGYKVGLYTSPHLKDFRERFRINGQMIDEQYIVDFVLKHKTFIEQLQPSFFEVSVAMAFEFFKNEKVNIAVIEVGLGGKYDSTNIIQPILSLITNIGYDHMNILGDTLELIAEQKAGIIKENVPIVISEYLPNTKPIFTKIANDNKASIYFASDIWYIEEVFETIDKLSLKIKNNNTFESLYIESELTGIYQISNILGVITCIIELKKQGYNISIENLKNGISKVIRNTKLAGRWQKLQDNPLIICDTGHNSHALAVTIKKIQSYDFSHKRMVLGFVKDKDLIAVFDLLPIDAIYYFCNFDSFRAASTQDLSEMAKKYKLSYTLHDDVNNGIKAANTEAKNTDIIFIGGSTYLVAEIDNLLLK